ncbi:MAG: T9SS type A sorting domain-containing protein [Bacteroidia bacterium]
MKSKLLFTVLLACICISNALAQTLPKYQSINSFYGTGTQNQDKTCSDVNGNHYAIGPYLGPTITFGTIVLTTSNIIGYYIVKYDAAGNIIYAKNTNIFDSGFLFLQKMFADQDGNLILEGEFNLSVTIENTLIISEGASDFFIAKYNALGNLSWAQSFGSIDNDDAYLAKPMDGNGNLVFAIVINFGSSITVDGITISPTNGKNTIIVTLDRDGNVSSTFVGLWTQNSGSNIGSPTAICTDVNGNIYVTGWVLPNTLKTYKYDDTGNLIWQRNGIASDDSWTNDIYADASGNVAITGYFKGPSITFGAITLSNIISNISYFRQAFVVKYGVNGNLLFAISEGSDLNEEGAEVCIDANGNTTVVGTFSGPNISLGTFNFANGDLISPLTNDIFFVKYDLLGGVLEADAFSGAEGEIIHDLTLCPNDDLLLTGTFDSPALTIENSILTKPAVGTGNYITRIIGTDGINWTGNISSNWFTPGNWATQQVPTKFDNVIIPATLHNPVITTGTANCKNLTLVDGNANLAMTGGTLNVYGSVTATHHDDFTLTGGTMKLFHGSIFPPDMHFKNLTITSVNNVSDDNLYQIPGTSVISGTMKLLGSSTSTDITLPIVDLKENNSLSITKDLIVSKGAIGYGLLNYFPGINDHTKYPYLIFNGTGTQNITMATNSYWNNVFFGLPLSANVFIDNPGVKFTNSTDAHLFLNLIVNKTFDLAGKNLRVLGKIVYTDGLNNTLKIANSTPAKGTIAINNDNEFGFDTDVQFIKIDKLNKLQYSNFGLQRLNETIALVNPLSVDTLVIEGFLDIMGQNLTIGETTSDDGFLDVESMGASVAKGTLKLQGNASTPRYQLVAKDLNNLTVNSPSGVELNNSPGINNIMKLFGTAKLVSGNFDTKDAAIALEKDNFIFTNAAHGYVSETAGNRFYSSTRTFGDNTSINGTIYKDTTISTVITSTNIGGLGFIVTCNNPIGGLLLQRNNAACTGVNGGSSIARTYYVINTGSALAANISIQYNDDELNGVNESDLAIFRRNNNGPGPGKVWKLVPSTVNITTNTVTTTASLPKLDLGSGTYYTLASASNPLKNTNAVSQQSVSNTTDVLVYPNPFTSKLNVQFNSETNEKATLQLVDIAGRLMNEQSVQVIIGLNDISICCTDKMPAGIYFLHITSSQTNNIIKVIKN